MHIINSLGLGGAESMLVKLAEDAYSSGRKLKIRTLLNGGDLWDRCAAVADVQRFSFKDLRYLIRGRVVLTCWMYHSCLFGVILKVINPNLRLVWNIRHSLSDLSKEKPMTARVIRLLKTFRFLASKVIFNSSVSMHQHADLVATPTAGYLIPNGFDLDIFSNDPDQRKRIREELGLAESDVCVGVLARFHPMKGHLIFAQALARMSPRPFALFVGLGTDTQIFREMIEPVLLNRWVGLGKKTDIRSLLSAMDLLVVPSEWGEAFPNVIGEAMLTETLVVATDVGDCRHIIQDQRFIAKPSNLEDLASKIKFALDLSKGEKKVFLKAQYERCKENYSISNISKLYTSLEEKLCAE